MFKIIIFMFLTVNHSFGYECGVFNSDKQGKETEVTGYQKYTGLFPWTVSLQVKVTQNQYRHVCSGAIISENWILTAAHCVEDPDTPIEHINAGSLVWDNSIYLHTPEKIIIHSSSRVTSDIALVKVTPSFAFKEGTMTDRAVGTICLPTEEQQFRGTVTLAGWQVSNDSSGTSNGALSAINVPIIDELVCQQYSNIFSPGPYMCTAPSKKKKKRSNCYAGIGSPLVGIINKKAYLVGLVSSTSTGSQCGVTNTPTIYSKVSTFRKWIRMNSGI